MNDQITSILSRATITNDRVTLPPDRLEPALYRAVNKVLLGIGGRWSTAQQAHLFSADPRPKIQAFLSSGVSVNEKKQRQAFFTPPELAENIANLADVAGHRVLEPSAGEGALVEACLAIHAKQVDCIEVNEEHKEALVGIRRAVTIADFLTLQPYQRPVFQQLVTELSDSGAVEVIEIPKGAFKSSGTQVPTLILRASVA